MNSGGGASVVVTGVGSTATGSEEAGVSVVSGFSAVGSAAEVGCSGSEDVSSGVDSGCSGCVSSGTGVDSVSSG